jgi:hypothetical protein
MDTRGEKTADIQNLEKCRKFFAVLMDESLAISKR